MNLEKSYLTDDERNLCLGVGEDLTGICFSFDFSKKMSVNPPRLSPENRKRLLDKMIFYKIFFVKSTCKKKLDAAHYKFLVEGITETLRGMLSTEKFANLEDEWLACSKIPFNEDSVGLLAEHAGIPMKTFNDDELKQLKVWVGVEILGVNVALDAAIKYLNTPHKEKPVQPVTTKPVQPAPTKSEPTKNLGWKLLGLATAVIIGFAAVFNYDGTHDTSPAKVSTPSTTQTSPPSSTSKLTPTRIAEKIPAPKKITPVAKIGVVTGYVSSHPFLNDDGLCEFTIDNTRNDMPVYVRIWDVVRERPVRAFTIAEGDKFTAYDLSPGTYEVRYKELYENDAPPFGSKSEPTTLEQHETYSGTSYSVVELTLYKVVNGNTTTTRIDADDV